MKELLWRLVGAILVAILMSLLRIGFGSLLGEHWGFSWSFAYGCICGSFAYPLIKRAIGSLSK